MAEETQHSETIAVDATSHSAPEMWYETPYAALILAAILFLLVYRKWVHPAVLRGLDGRSLRIRDQLEPNHCLPTIAISKKKP
jgi:hypothetical protein